MLDRLLEDSHRRFKSSCSAAAGREGAENLSNKAIAWCPSSGTNSLNCSFSLKHYCVPSGGKFVSLLSQSWTLLKGAVNGFVEDEALTRGAAIAFYTATSFAPVLLIVIAIAGLVYGREAAQGAIATQLGDLMGGQTAELLQTAVASSKSKSSGFLAAWHARPWIPSYSRAGTSGATSWLTELL
jgi:hypothetical protein